MKISKAVIPSVIVFQSAELLLVDYEGNPFVAMKPLVEGMGLNWKTQRAKLGSSQLASFFTKIAVVTPAGKHRSMVCIPLRKLVGWLMTMNVDNMQPYLRQRVRAYQQECDDMLWRHWLLGRPQCAKPALCAEEATELADRYLAKHRDAILDAGGSVPTLDPATESCVATRLAMLLLRDKRWLVTFNGSGGPQLMDVPTDAGIFTPDRMLRWIRENDGAYLSFMPELLHAIGDRLKVSS